MKVKELKEIINNIPDDADVSYWDDSFKNVPIEKEDVSYDENTNWLLFKI